MKKKIYIAIIIFLLLAIIGIIVYNIKNGNESINKSNDTGVKEVDFSSYEEKEIILKDSDVTIKSQGVYTISGDLTNKNITIDSSGNVKLILDGVNITSKNEPCINITSGEIVYIELRGDNKLVSETTSELNGAIYSKGDLLFSGEGSLNIESNIDGIVTKDDLQIDSGTYVIKAKDDGLVGRDSIKINNGDIKITSDGDGIKTTNENKGNINIINGTINIDSKLDGIQAIGSLTIDDGNIDIKSGNGSSVKSTDKGWMNNQSTDSIKGIKSDVDITINGGKININSEDDSIHSNGNIVIKKADITLASGDDGIHADKDITSTGNINISESYEGIEGANITIDGGEISVVSKDDGFNAAGGDGSSQGRMGANRGYDSSRTYTLTINDGKIYVNASGDGLDSNGDIYINGGEIYIDGPTSNGDAALDYGDGGNCKFEITGGTLIAVGSSGMAVAPTSGTKQTSVLINLSSSYSEKIEFGDIKYTPTKSYNSILISSPKISEGKEYTLKIDGKDVQTLTLSDTVTTSGNTNKGGFGGNRGGMSDGNMPEGNMIPGDRHQGGNGGKGFRQMNN